jgi:hypothetical protein
VKLIYLYFIAFQGLFNFEDGNVSIGSTNTHTSKTLYPNVKKDAASGITLIDCAGFEDTRSPEKDLVASYLTKRFMDSTKKIKIVIVVNFSKLLLDEDRTAFLKVLKHVATLLKNNHHSFHNSIGLLATKINDTRSDELVLYSIRICLEDTLKYLMEAAPNSTVEIDILEYLLHNRKFALFRKPACSPRNGESCWEIEQLAKGWKDMRKLFFDDMTFAENYGKFNITLSPDSKLRLSDKETLEAERKLYSLIDIDITPGLINIFDVNSKDLGPHFIDFCNTYLAQLAEIKSQDDLVQFFREHKLSQITVNEFLFCVSKVEFLLSATERSDETFAKVNNNILNLHGGLSKIIAHVEATCVNFISSEKCKLDSEIVEISKSFRSYLDKSISKTDDRYFAELLDSHKANFGSISNYKELLNFADELRVDTTKIKNILTLFQSANYKSVLEDMQGKVAKLNGEMQGFDQFFSTQKDSFVKKLKTNVRVIGDNLFSSLTEIIVNKIESSEDLTGGSKLSDSISLSLKSITCFEEFASFVSEHDSGSGNLLEQLGWQTNVLIKWSEQKDQLEYVMQKILSLGQQIESSKNFLGLLGDIQAQAENNYSAISSYNEVGSLLCARDHDEFKVRVPILTKFGFSEKVVSSLIGLTLNSENIRRVVNILLTNLSVKGELSSSMPTNSWPVLRHHDTILVVSEVMKKSPHSSAETIVLMASRRLIIEGDLSFKNQHVILMAPVIDFKEQTVIQLDGEDGAQHPDKKAPNAETSGENGQDGLDGNPGYSSGSLSVFALNMVNPRNLTVRSKGGDGGAGQDGGDGIKGEEGEKIIKEITMYEQNNGIIASLMGIIRPKIEERSSTNYYLKENATSGGKGADASAGAAPGTVEFFLRNNENANFFIERLNGMSGKPGRGGKAGQNPKITRSQKPAEPRRSVMSYLKAFRRPGLDDDVDDGDVDDGDVDGDDVDDDKPEETTASDGADGSVQITPTSTPQYKYNRANINQLINEYITLAKKTNCRAETSEFIEFVSSVAVVP